MRKFRKKALKTIKAHLLEFFVIGVLFGIAEDVLAIMLHQGHFSLSLRMVYIAAVVAIPFAIVSELIVDWSEIFRIKSNKK